MFARIGRALVLCIGVMMLLWGAYMPLVAVCGSQAEGQITHVRRQGGERREAVPNRYTYMISYEFRLPNGERVTGHTQRVGDYFSPKQVSIGRRVDVRYFSFLPSLAVMDRNWGSLIENMVVACVGAVLVFLLGFQKRKRRSSKQVHRS